MTSKISGLSSAPVQPDVSASAPSSGVGGSLTSAAGGQGASSATAAGSGEVQITDSASQLAALEQTVRSMPAVDEARVTQLRTAIEQGTYTVQPQHVADQLMQVEQSLAQLPES